MQLFVLLLLIGAATVRSVEVRFENKDSGFFLKHTPRANGARPPEPVASAPPGALLSLDRFTVLQTAQPASVRATYGPFSTKQTVPARYSVPDPLETPRRNVSLLELQDVTSHRLDVSAHLVYKEIARDLPVIRVLFHTGSETGVRRVSTRTRRVCITLHASLNSSSLSASCAPEGEEGACLTELIVPASWWPAEGKGKRPPRTVKLTYSATEVADNTGACGRVSVQPAWNLGVVTLVSARAGYREIRAGDTALLVPRALLYPQARIHLPFVVRKDAIPAISHVVIKMRVKSGMRLLTAIPASAQWSITSEVKTKVATLTATRVDQQNGDSLQSDASDSGLWEEVVTWLVEVGGDTEAGEGEGGRGAARLAWSVRAAAGVTTEPPGADHPRLNTRLDIEKDDIQAVLPITKTWELLNTAVLTGTQVSQPMKVLIVSQAGTVADVTMQSSCHSEDESVLKVSSSCSSVYVDGSEKRGSSNASVIVKYGTYTGLARFTVWMPEFPLEIDVDDNRLSQIKGWRVSEEFGSGKDRLKRSMSARGWSGASPRVEPNGLSETRACRLRYQQSPVEVFAHFMAEDHDSGRVSHFVNRRTYLKVTELVMVLMRVSDPRIATLHGRILQGRSVGRTEVQVLSPITGRVIGAREVRVVNDKVSISRLSVRVVSGMQLNISPDPTIENGYVSETTITRRLTAQYQEGLLDIEVEYSDSTKTPLRDVAMSDYYLLVESLDPEVVAFAPKVASRHPRVIAVGEGSGELLRVTLLTSDECRGGAIRRVALPGKGDAKTPVNLRSIAGALASAAAAVEVDFSNGDLLQRPDTPQNDDIMARGGPRSQLADMSDILFRGLSPFKDENNEPTVQAHQYGSSIRNGQRNRHASTSSMSPLEIGMYVLLGAFCFAIVIFVVSCVVYASKLKPAQEHSNKGMGLPMPSYNTGNGKIQVAGLIGTTMAIGRDRSSSESTTNVHDWVWLGRATMERKSNYSGNRNSTQNGNIVDEREMRITSNPLNYNYADPDDAIKVENGNVLMNSFDNPNSIELPLQNDNGNKKAIDSTTYCKKTNRPGRHNSEDSARNWQIESNPHDDYRPPVPPHRNAQTFEATPPVNPYRLIPESVMPPTRRSHHSRHKKHERESSAHKSPETRRGVDRIIDLNKGRSYTPTRELLERKHVDSAKQKDDEPLLNEVESLANKEDCARLFEFDNDAPMILENKDYRELVCLNREMDDSKRTFTKPESPDYMKDSGIVETLGPWCDGAKHMYKELAPMLIEATRDRRAGAYFSQRISLAIQSGNVASFVGTMPQDDMDMALGLADMQSRHKSRAKDETREKIFKSEFVEAANENNGGSSPEVKKATIVGNSMYLRTEGSSDERPVPDGVATESLGLDDLEMDYDQIMHYFHNLKESNA